MTGKAKELLVRGAAELGIRLSPEQTAQFGSFAMELTKWGKKINLTAIKEETDIAVKHFVDSLTLLKVVEEQGHLLDLGSGAGFPSIPVKIVRQGLQIVSIDAVEKKVMFQRHAARLLGLAGFEAIHARGEALAATFGGRFDWVVSRAFSDIPTFVHIALPLVSDEGLLLAMKGKEGREEAIAAEPRLAEMSIAVREVLEFQLPCSGDARSIVVMQKN